MLEMIKNAFRVKDIRNKILFTIFMLFVIRIGSNIPIPGVATDFFSNLIDKFNARDAFGFISTMTGGSLEQMSVLALSITPYITSSIITELLTIAIPPLEEIRKEGDDGRRKIAEYTRYVTVALAFLESTAMAIGFGNQGFLVDYNALSVIVAIVSMTAGSAFLMWIGERITENGLGNGISIVLLFNILSSFPQDLRTLYEKFMNGKAPAFQVTYAIFVTAALFALVVISVILESARREIPVQYASRIAGRSSMGGRESNIPLKVNTAGVIPVIFSTSIMSLPIIVLQFLDAINTPVGQVLQVLNSGTWFKAEYPQFSIGAVIYVFLTIFFAYFYTSITFNPSEVSMNIKKQGGFIPGIRPGSETSAYLERLLNYIIFIGAVGLVLVSLIPTVASSIFNISRISFAGTSLLIVVGVVLETLEVIKSQLIIRNYRDFLS